MSDEDRLATRGRQRGLSSLTQDEVELLAYAWHPEARAMVARDPDRVWFVNGIACACRGQDRTHGHGTNLTDPHRDASGHAPHVAWITFPPLADWAAGLDVQWPWADVLVAVAAARAAWDAWGTRIHTCHEGHGCRAPLAVIQAASEWVRCECPKHWASLLQAADKTRVSWVPRPCYMATGGRVDLGTVMEAAAQEVFSHERREQPGGRLTAALEFRCAHNAHARIQTRIRDALAGWLLEGTPP